VAGIYLMQLLAGVLNSGFSVDKLIVWAVNVAVTIITVVIVLVILGVTAFFVVVGGSDLVNRFVAGRAVGTLGVVLAAVGLLGETYQLGAVITG